MRGRSAASSARPSLTARGGHRATSAGGRIACLAVVVGFVGPRATSAQQEFLVTQSELYINATVIDGRGGPPRPASAILVWGGEVRGIGSRGQMSIPQGTRIVDLGGAFVIPGFIDAQASPRTEADLHQLLAAGITGVRDGNLALAEYERRGRGKFGEDPVPQPFIGGPVLDYGPDAVGVPLDSEERAVEAVQRQGDDDAEFVSVSPTVPADWLVAMARAARRADAAIWLDRSDGWLLGLRAGADVASRLVSGDPEMLPEGGPSLDSETHAEWLSRVEPDGAEMDRAVSALLSRDASVVPLLVSAERTSGCATRRAACRALTDQEREQLWTTWPKAEALVRALQEQGVRLLVGSDAPRSSEFGAGFHRELELLVNAGLSELEVIGMATRNAATVLGQLHERGTIEPGKRADFLILENDPTVDIENASQIAMIVLGGRPWRLTDEGTWERARFN